MAAGEIPGVGWALWGKKAGTSSDYSVLASSTELFSRTDFGKIITRFAAGAPDSRATGPGELPWITVSWVGVDSSLRLGIAITDKTGHVDAVGRPITQTSYFCVPYADVARMGLSYTAVYEAVAPIALPAQDGRLISLTVTPEAPGEAVRRVEDFGDRIAGTAAAQLLDRPVTITQAEGSTLRQRLEFIDAVASLLPFGFRAKLTAGTWSDTGARHRLRLAFASRPREDAAILAWRQGGDVSGGDIAREYFEHLRQLRSGAAAHGRKFDVPQVVAHLAASTDQQRFEQPQEALTVLRLIDLPDRVLAAVRNGGPLKVAEFRQVFQLGHIDAMEQGPRVELLTALSRIGEAEDWPAIERVLPDVPDAPGAGYVLTQFGWRVLWTAEPDGEVLRQCLAQADARGIGDSVLAGLVQMPDGGTGPPPAAREAADLLARTALTRPQAYPVTAGGLAAQPAAVAEYLAALASAGHQAPECLQWLAPSLPAELATSFGAALGLRQGEVPVKDLARLAGLSGCVRALLATASAGGRLELVLPSFIRWICGYPELDAATPSYWSEHLRGLRAATPPLQASLDLALLAVGAAPTALPPARQADALEYLGRFTELWKQVRKAPEGSRERCVRALARYLDKPRWAESRGQAEVVTMLVEQLRADDTGNFLLGVVASALGANPAARQWDFARKWLAHVREKDPAAIRTGLQKQLETVAPGTDPAQIAALCRSAHREGISDEAAFYLLGSSRAIDSVDAACALFGALRREFERHGEDQVATWDWVLGFAQQASRGRFGQLVADGFRDRQSRLARLEIRVQLDILHTLAERPGQSELELTDEERADLDQVREDIDLLVKKSRMRFFIKKVTRGGNEAPPAPEPPR
jgi:hypothetical protein